ncbi:MAG: hypothetical protein H6823_07750 [Planctomycetaceae bacterium]|nr:hypothetical protein [Planctomycetaceae bacterium]
MSVFSLGPRMKRLAFRKQIYILTLAISLVGSAVSAYAQSRNYTGPFGTTVVNPFVDHQAAIAYPSTERRATSFESGNEYQFPNQFSAPQAFPHTDSDGSWIRESATNAVRLPPVGGITHFDRLPGISSGEPGLSTGDAWPHFDPVSVTSAPVTLPQWNPPQNPWSANPYWYANTLIQEQLPPANPQTPPIAPRQPVGPSQPTDGQPDAPQGPIGEAPEEEDVTTQFLRQSTLVLEPGMLQIDAGLLYAWQQSQLITVLPPGVPVFELVRNRNFIVPLSFRYGLTSKVETFLSVPLGLGIVERADPLYHDVTMRGPLGDISGGFVFEVARAHGEMPDITATFTATAPTGGDPVFGRNVATVGSGFWSLSAGLNFVKSYDPVALFGSFGLRHDFQEDVFGGNIVQPGETFYYSYGAAFGVNNDISFTATFSGAYQGRTQLNGTAIPNSSSEPMSLRLGLVRRVKSDLRMQPFISFGLTPSAPDASLGVVFTRDVKTARHGHTYK